MVLPSGTLLSLPIPYSGDKRRFSELKCEDSSVLNLMRQVGMKAFDQNSACHLDPDINKDLMERQQGWKGAFGQMGGAQGHLENNGIAIGDVFLFFGWFRKTAEDTLGRLRYTGSDFHLIYGFLQVGEILRVNDNMTLPSWLSDHPHTNREKYVRLTGGENNTIYIASDELTFLKGFSGYGSFKFHPDLVLTKVGERKSRWDLPPEFKGLKITYHTDESWKNDYFQSAAKGQEFIFEEIGVVERWSQNIIKTGLGAQK